MSCGNARRKPSIRVMCGAISPIKLSGPMVSVAAAVSAEASNSNTMRVGVSAIPTARAVSPPSGSTVSQRRHSGVSASNISITHSEFRACCGVTL